VTAAYLDASAIVKLAVDEEGAQAMRAAIAGWSRLVTSRVGVIEARRAIARRARVTPAIEAVLDRVELLELDVVVARHAAAVEPATIRTLDAIHLASAELIRPELDAFVTYDDRLAEAARARGFRVIAPGAV